MNREQVSKYFSPRVDVQQNFALSFYARIYKIAEPKSHPYVMTHIKKMNGYTHFLEIALEKN